MERGDRVHLPHDLYLVLGFARGLVIRTGDNTVMGRIANLTSGLNSESTTLARDMSYLVRMIVVSAFVMGIIFFIVVILLGTDFTNAIIFLIGIIMGNVPEGLLATVTVSI